MSVVPPKALDRLQFYENHVAPFTTNAVAIGISASEATDLSTKTTAAREAYNAKQAAEQSARVATNAWLSAVNVMSVAGSAIMKKIRATAEVAGGTSVYDLAEIPPPATPSPVGPPGQPTALKVALDAVGGLELKWKCPNPQNAAGTTYNIFRSIGTPSGGEFTYIGGTGVREFTDQTVPAGSALVVYKIQAVRSTQVGPWATFNIFFGTGSVGGGMTVASVEDSTPPKLAA
jgi:hypothetical protein